MIAIMREIEDKYRPPEYLPSRKEIEEESNAIREKWSENETRKRAALPDPVEFITKTEDDLNREVSEAIEAI